MRRRRLTAKTRVNLNEPTILERKLCKEDAGYCFKELDVVIIDPNQSGRQYFLTHFHEWAHHAFPDLTEDQIFALEATFGLSLWKTVLKLRKRKKI